MLALPCIQSGPGKVDRRVWKDPAQHDPAGGRPDQAAGGVQPGETAPGAQGRVRGQSQGAA